MTTRILHVVCAVLLAFATSGASPLQPAKSSGEGTARAVAAADAFLATLDPVQRQKANVELNEQTRIIWSNLPTGAKMQVGATERNGVKLADLAPAQERAALALVAATLSPDGFQKAMAIVDADQVLEERSAPTRKAGAPVRFGRGEYYVAVLGKPSATASWMIQFGGHHLAINVTLAGREKVLAPTHTGTQPASFTLDGRTVRPLGDENDKAFTLINALDDEQKKQAILSYEVRNLVLGPGNDGKMIAPEGVRVSTFTPAQRSMLVDLIREWVDILEEEAAATKIKDVEAGLAGTYFAWAGSTTNGNGAYFRIHGPTVLIEYAPQGPADTNIDHIHTIFRDPTNDYAARVISR